MDECHSFDFPLIRYCINSGLNDLAQLLADAYMVSLEDTSEGQEVVISYLTKQRRSRDALAQSHRIRELQSACRNVSGVQLGIRVLI